MPDRPARSTATWRMPFTGPRPAVGHALGLAVVASAIALACAALIHREHELRRTHAHYLAATLARLTAAEVGRLLQPGWPPGTTEAQRQQALAGGQDGRWQVASVQVASPQAARPPLANPPLPDRPQAWTVLWRATPAAAGGTPPLAVFSLPEAPLAQALQGLGVGPRGAATVRTEDLALVYRHAPGATEPFRRGSRATSGALQAIAQAGTAQGHFEATTALDGIPRINAYIRTRASPLYVLVGVPTSDYPHGWNRADAFLALTSLALMAGALWVARTYRRIARTERQSLSLQYAAIVDNACDAIVSKRLDGTVVSWNAAAERLFGWRSDEMVGQNIGRLIPADLQAEEDGIVQALARGDVVAGLETERLHRDGQRIAVSVTISPVRDPLGRVIGASKIARDITRQKALEREIRALALEDALTHLPNRRLLDERLAHTLLSGARQQTWSGLFMVDLDDFKQVNDTWGHDVGDQLLAEVARRLRQAVREVDTVARLGGDEFVVLCQGLGADEASAQAHLQELWDRMLAQVETPWTRLGPDWTPRISVGQALIPPQERSAEAVLHRADVHMYATKRARKARTVRAVTEQGR